MGSTLVRKKLRTRVYQNAGNQHPWRNTCPLGQRLRHAGIKLSVWSVVQWSKVSNRRWHRWTQPGGAGNPKPEIRKKSESRITGSITSRKGREGREGLGTAEYIAGRSRNRRWERADGRGQKAQVRDQKSEVGSQRSEVSGQWSMVP
jgi:hypothetical protein